MIGLHTSIDYCEGLEMAVVRQGSGSVQENASGDAIASIIIPAHNEASVIGRLLKELPKSIGSRALQIVVACNGCTDRTADVARKYGALVVEVEESSKIAALNAGDDVAEVFPRLYIDADVVLTRKTIADLVQALSEPGVLCAAPGYFLDLAERPWTVRAYFAVWQSLMELRNGYVGSGVYALSEAGRARFGRFPNVVADDTFVRNQFKSTERRVIATDPSVIQPPLTLRALLLRRIRVNIGNFQLAASPEYRALPGSTETPMPWWRVVVVRPWLLPAAIIYGAVNSLAHFAAIYQFRGKGPVNWARDSTTRS